MAAVEEYLQVGDLTPLSNLNETDSVVIQTGGENGDVMLAMFSDIISNLLEPIFAKLDSPEFTGEPTAPTITDMTASDERIATTEFVQSLVEDKAGVASPEFTGTAHFADNTPTTVDGDGNTVYIANKSHIDEVKALITAANNNLSSLAGQIMALNTLLADAIAVKSYSYSYSIAANGTESVTGSNFKVATPTGYVPLGVRRATSGSARVGITGIIPDATGSSSVLTLVNTSASSVTGTATIRVLYVKSSMFKVL